MSDLFLKPLEPSAIVTMLAYLDIESARKRILREMVFSRGPVVRLDKKADASHRALLQTANAHLVNTIIWKESDHVAAKSLPNGVEKFFQGENITQHALAVHMCTSPDQNSAMVSLVRSVAIAGAAYNLVDVNAVHIKKNFLRGTGLLNEYMTEFTKELEYIANSIVTRSDKRDRS